MSEIRARLLPALPGDPALVGCPPLPCMASIASSRCRPHFGDLRWLPRFAMTRKPTHTPTPSKAKAIASARAPPPALETRRGSRGADAGREPPRPRGGQARDATSGKDRRRRGSLDLRSRVSIPRRVLCAAAPEMSVESPGRAAGS
ncbi:hypothetical protein ZWY2020_054871 [Hordeum vulgare]|nr:hypothetical protein ZWY2020_054871 [Hordeum vulgare]